MEKATATVRVTATHSKCIKFLWGLILLLAQSNSVASNAIVKSLPGFPGELPFLLETGYIGVGELDEEVQLFYYFIESEGQPATDPLVLWLTGGPGCSALSGLMYEVGPLGFDYKRSCEIQTPVLVLNDYSWTKVANIIFLDASVGTGFSYAKTSGGYNTSDEKSTADTYMFLRKWLLVHPKFQKNPVYIAGDSYSGIAVPVIVKKISDGNKAGNLPQINLKGYVLGNPYTDNQYDLNARVNFAYRVGLLSDDLYEETKFDCHGEFAFPNKSDAGCIEHLEMVNQCLKDINPPMVLEPLCSSLNTKPNKLNSGSSHPGVNVSDSLLSEVNPIGRWCRDYNYIFINIWANDKVVQEALHVRIGTIKEWDRCNRSLSYVEDIRSSLDYHRNLTSEDLRAIVYSGDHDMVIPYVGTEEWIRSLNLKVPSDGEWRPWFVDGQVAGYTEMYREKKYSLTFATVKGGGHTAPEYKPKECFDMISRWFAYYFL
ncbi:serine carboxypeptidase-like 18 isoform X1 [Gastrolobium bilobum]|uniref:serine carboxypeptidase-like 18 isoform X1 n=1 Tax=Gastrolobium bilobum TaxID=150636 RepID=UPI002AB0D893|nr:serine carboxypeptidase-like 18 isoform X1 [Gastrolobium bilobum]